MVQHPQTVSPRRSAALDGVFHALSDGTRRAVLAQLRAGPASVSELAQRHHLSLPGFIKHLRILEDAGLIARQKTGRVVHCRLTGAALREAHDWLARYDEFWTTRLDRLEAFLQRKENASWRSHSTKPPGSKSGGPSAPPSTPSGRRGRTPRK